MRWKNLLISSAVALGLLSGTAYYQWTNIKRCYSYAKCFYVEIPAKYDDDYSLLEKLSNGKINGKPAEANMMSEEELVQNENQWYKISKAGAIGLSQLRPIAIDQNMLIWFSFSRRKNLNDEERMTYEVIDGFIGDDLRKIPKKKFRNEFWYKKSRNKKPLRDYVMHDIKFNADTNHHYGLANYAYTDLKAHELARKYNLNYDPKLSAVVYTMGVKGTEDKIKQYNKDFYSHLPMEVKDKLIRRAIYLWRLEHEAQDTH